jgi:Fatty acid desaturase
MISIRWEGTVSTVDMLGLYLGSVFAPNHKGMPILSRDDDSDFLRRQVLTARNVRGGRLTDLLLGGLNYQIEHHLFPSMPRPSLRRAQPLVHAYLPGSWPALRADQLDRLLSAGAAPSGQRGPRRPARRFGGRPPHRTFGAPRRPMIGEYQTLPEVTPTGTVSSAVGESGVLRLARPAVECGRRR